MTRDRAFAEELFDLLAKGLIEFEEGDDTRGPHVRPTTCDDVSIRAPRPAGALGGSRGHGEKGGQRR